MDVTKGLNPTNYFSGTKLFLLSLFLICCSSLNEALAQRPSTARKQAAQRNPISGAYAGTLNAGVGPGYFGYDHIPLMMNYELVELTPHLTLAPTIGYVDNQVPVGLKAHIYFDQLLGLHHRLDFYGAVSGGLALQGIEKSEEYGVGQSRFHPWYSLHFGGRYHFNHSMSGLVDLGSNYAALGLSLKL